MSVTFQKRVIRITVLSMALAIMLIGISIFSYNYFAYTLAIRSFTEILKASTSSQLNEIIPTLLIEEQRNAIPLILEKFKRNENLSNISLFNAEIENFKSQSKQCHNEGKFIICRDSNNLSLAYPMAISGKMYGYFVKEKKIDSAYLDSKEVYLIELFLLATTISFVFYFLSLLKISSKEIPESLNLLLKWVEDSLSKNNEKLKPNLKFDEFNALANQISILLNDRKDQIVQKELITLATQVAHDIRSPLSVLNMITSSTQNLDNEKKDLIHSSIQRINDIANDLLKKGKSHSIEINYLKNPNNYISEALLINPMIYEIISEKRLLLNKQYNTVITNSPDYQYGIFVCLNPSHLKRTLSNLINNSIEAIGDSLGNIEIAITSNEKHAIIRIIDNGPGIPSHILKKLGQESVSFGKNNTESGSGLGVLHAKNTIENMGGQFEITSTIGKGTEVKITLPLAEAPSWFLKKLNLKVNSNILVCDDDSSIIALWKKRLSVFSNIDANYFTNLSSLKSFLITNQDLNFTLLIDYEFSGEKQTGLDFIIENNLASKSILVTSHYDEPDVIQKCIEHNIKQIPKNICALVPIEMASSKEYYDAVVLDNEDLQVRSWQFAAIQKGKNILTFSNSDEFLSALSNIDHHTPIFIDSILGEDIKGEDIAKKINDLGFKNIYMSSGHDPSHFSDMTFLKGVIGKTPFFP